MAAKNRSTGTEAFMIGFAPNDAHQRRRKSDARYETDAESRRPVHVPGWAVRDQVVEPWHSLLLLKLGGEQTDILLACANKRISLPRGVPVLASVTPCLWPQEEEERIRILLQGNGVVLLQGGPINCNLPERAKALVSFEDLVHLNGAGGSETS